MIKGSGTGVDGKPLLLLGLTGENVTRLAASEPILIDAAELEAVGLPGMHVAILYGRTENDLVAELLPFWRR